MKTKKIESCLLSRQEGDQSSFLFEEWSGGEGQTAAQASPISWLNISKETTTTTTNTKGREKQGRNNNGGDGNEEDDDNDQPKKKKKKKKKKKIYMEIQYCEALGGEKRRTNEPVREREEKKGKIQSPIYALSFILITFELPPPPSLRHLPCLSSSSHSGFLLLE